MKGGKMKERKTKQISLTEEEVKDAQLELEGARLSIEATEFNINQMNESIKLQLPARVAMKKAREQLKQLDGMLERLKFNETYFEKQVRNKVREEEVYDEKGDQPEDLPKLNE
jgi:hypothetical protein